DELSGAEADDREAVAAGVKVLLASERRRLGGTGGAGPWHASDAFQLDGERRLRRPVLVDGAPREVELVWAGGTFAVEVDGEPQPACDASELDWENGAGGFMPFGDEPVAEPTDQLTACVLHRLRHIEVSWPTYDADALEAGDASDLVKAPITGRVAKLHVAVGDEVEENQPVAVVEAMKMEHVLTSPRTGRIARLDYAEGEQVTEGAIILALEAEEAAS
ncbi:MAG: hypothetical protein KDJ36_11660, partial [Hyphomicrobiaceae bacterium]|nr:hypothetical protein [Hyphomicrobiaceae bacterium]